MSAALPIPRRRNIMGTRFGVQKRSASLSTRNLRLGPTPKGAMRIKRSLGNARLCTDLGREHIQY